MNNIIPAIIGQNFKEVKEKIDLLEGHVLWAQLDIMDGKFVPPSTWQTAMDLKTITGQIKLEAHFMVDNPEEIIEDWIEVVDRIWIQIEAKGQPMETLRAIKETTVVEAGVSVEMQTDLEELLPLIKELGLVQLMAIDKIGYQGHKFNQKVLERIKFLRQECPDAIIQIDGGINQETAGLVLAAGASQLAVGSAIWQTEDPLHTLQQFQSL
ncbi:MAG: ribulose-phosphate 3-epimerase [Patescibacteria group bacterium]